MRIFRRKEVKLDIKIVQVGDIILAGGNVYKVEANHLQQLAVKKIGAN